jgi:hypothetical protein
MLLMNVKKPASITRRLHLDGFLYNRSAIAFVLFFGLAIWAFWTSYYGKLTADFPTAIRFHGVTMSLWCLMLISQAFLIRLKKNKIHRLIGKLSYIIVPFILFSGAHLAQITINDSPPGSELYYYLIALMFNSLILFATLYGLAMWNRKKPLTHARFMACTIFPLFTPITDRLIYKYFEELIPLAPTLNGIPMVPALGFALADVILIGLLVWDWRAHKRLDVFPLVLALTVIYHLSVLTFYRFSFWKQTGDLFMSFPLS